MQYPKARIDVHLTHTTLTPPQLLHSKEGRTPRGSLQRRISIEHALLEQEEHRAEEAL